MSPEDWSDADLEAVAWRGWPGLEHRYLGSWVLRAGGGFTGRANSALVLGDPGSDLPAAIAEVEAYYRARGLRPRLQVPLPLAAPVDAWVHKRGWPAIDLVDVMTAAVPVVLADHPPAVDLPPVSISREADQDWLGAYHYRGGTLPAHAVDVIHAGSGVAFATVRDGDAVVAIARGAVERGWVGVTAVEVAAESRRRGLGTHVVRELLAWAGREGGARLAYLQVAAENAAATRVYARMGFRTHHQYHYRLAPEPTSGPASID